MAGAVARRLPVSVLREALLMGAVNVPGEWAAVRLLIGHGGFLTRPDFLTTCVTVLPGEDGEVGCVAYVDWARAAIWESECAHLSPAQKTVLHVALLLARGEVTELPGGLARMVVLAVIEAAGLDEAALLLGVGGRS